MLEVDAFFDELGDADLLGALNSRGQLVRSGRIQIGDIMASAQKSIAAHPITTLENPGPIVNGVTERSFQEALMRALELFNNQAQSKRPSS